MIHKNKKTNELDIDGMSLEEQLIQDAVAERKARALAHKQDIEKLSDIKTKVLRGKDLGLDLKNLDKEAEIAKYKGYHPVGYSVVVRLFTEAQDKETGIIDTDKEHAEQVYSAFLGMVVSIAPDAYNPEARDRDGVLRFPNGPWCKVGDFISFPKSSGYYYYYNHPDGTTSPLYIIKEHAPDGVVDDADVNSVKRR